MKTLIMILSCALVTGAMASIPTNHLALAVEKITEAKSFSLDGVGTLPYREFFAPSPKGEKVPLVIFLHGSSRRGTDNRVQLSQCMPELTSYVARHGGALVVAPQCALGGSWTSCARGEMVFKMADKMTPHGQLALALAREKAMDARVDPTRVYITGLSMGGHGTWELIARAPDLFAAAVPICGGGDPRAADKLQNLPIWAFHATDDAVVLPCRQRAMVSAIWAKGGQKLSYTEYPTGGHSVWRRVYGQSATWKWLFSQKKHLDSK